MQIIIASLTNMLPTDALSFYFKLIKSIVIETKVYLNILNLTRLFFFLFVCWSGDFTLIYKYTNYP